MRNSFVAAIIILLAATAVAQPSTETELGERVWVRQLSANTWVVRSISKIEGFGDVESNAVLAVGAKESVLIDTPVTNEQTEAVLKWADATLRRPVRHLIVTHWHSDRMGGIDAAHARNIESYAFGKTLELAKQHGLTLPKHELKAEERLTLSGIDLETFYPGHGHTADNIVAWLPKEHILDGGCFVKAASSKTLGNLAEINPPEWTKGIRAVQQRFADAKTVIPGHGAVGGPELLAHTAELIKAHTTQLAK
jgi:metallo-beta-lactamase class B